MDKDIKEFIKKNASLIEDEKWDMLYENAFMELASPGDLTRIFHQAHIDPLSEIDFIPVGYLMKFDQGMPWGYEIPKHIKRIRGSAFAYNPTLNYIYIPKSVNKIGPGVFVNNNSLRLIHYEGTEKEWDEISKHYSWDNYSSISEIKFNS